MLRRASLLSLMLSAPAFSQQPVTAGATRPKLEVLTSLPESQLFPLMNLVSTSLGVRCDYCHVQATPDLSRTPSNSGGWVWDRDDKLPKRRARDMMKMVVALNATHFKGESRVTCFTCHRGTTQPTRLPSLPPAPPGTFRTAGPTPLPPAERVWSAYVAAVVQLEAPSPNIGTIIRGWDDRPEGRYARFEVIIAGSDRYRLTLTAPDALTRQTTDGTRAWFATNDQVQVSSSPADLARMQRIATRYRPVKEQPPNARIIGVERVDDHDAWVMQGRVDSITTRTSYFDVITGLLRREITTTETILLPLEEQIDYDEYRNVNGVQMPFRIRTSDGAPYSNTTRLILDILRNVPVADSTFRISRQ
jgi:hypothetical protein